MQVERVEDLVEITKSFRNFDALKYIENKKILINNFFKNQGLDSAVIGISGGVDSAVVYKLLVSASEMKDSPIKKIIPVIAPIEGRGVSGQQEARSKAEELIDKHHPLVVSKLGAAYNDIIHSISVLNFSLETDAWSEGQMASVLRTPLFYYIAALLQTKGYKSIVVGTTNRDEGSYIGFFGKASDAMVDLQPIADIHKSEVYLVAKLLNVPERIIKSIPKGDVYNEEVDEQMIGAPYWFLEMFLILKDMGISPQSISSFEGTIYQDYILNIEKIHKKNEHKYMVGSPAHFIDFYKRKVEGGW